MVRNRLRSTSSPISDTIPAVGVYASGPIWGRIVDTRGPQILLGGAFILLLAGYSGMRHYFDAGVPMTDSIAATISLFGFCVLVACCFMTGAGGNAGLTAGVNTTAKTFPDRAVSDFFILLHSNADAET
jgi:hypothetical protein